MRKFVNFFVGKKQGKGMCLVGDSHFQHALNFTVGTNRCQIVQTGSMESYLCDNL